MRLEQLEYLLEIQKTHSINNAAKNLHVSQQNISQSIKQLEDELNLTLLERSKKGTNFTPAGYVVLNHAQKVLHELSLLNSDAADLRAESDSLKGILNIQYATGFNIEHIFNSLKRFSAHHPKVKVHIYEESIRNVLSALYHRSIDIALIASNEDFHFNNAIDNHELQSLSIFPLGEEPLYTAVSHVSPLAEQKTITASKIIQYPLVMFYQEKEEPTLNNYLINYLSNFGEPNIQLITNAFELYVKAIANDHGIGFVSKSYSNLLSTYFSEEIALIPLRPSLTLIQSYAINNSHYNTTLINAYIPYLKEQF